MNLCSKKAAAAILGAMLMMSSITGCAAIAADAETEMAQTEAADTSDESETTGGSAEGTTYTVDEDGNLILPDSEVEAAFSKRDMKSESEIDAEDIEELVLDGESVTITEEGIYHVTGELADGQIIIDAGEDAKVQLILDGVSIYCEDSAAICVRSADKVFLTLAEGSENTLSGGTEYVTDTDEDGDTINVDGVIFARCDLTINGTGSLTVNAQYKHGIVCKDTLAVTGGTIEITSVGQCLQAKDGIKILDGTFTLTSEGKAIKSENDSDASLGNIYIAGGTFTISAGDDGLHAGGSIVIDGGELTIASGDDGIHADVDLIVNDGTIIVTESYEGLEAMRITVNGGVIDVTSSDDGMNAATPSSGTSSDAWGDFGGGDMPDMSGNMPDMSGDMPDWSDGEMPDWSDGEMPDWSDGEMPDWSDGEMPDWNDGEMPDWNDGEMPDWNDGEMPDMNGGGMMGGGFGDPDSDENAWMVINGGTVTVTCGGDGLDSNGWLYVNGGSVTVYGPLDGANGSLDSGLGCVVNGGTVICAGSSGMAETFGSESTQCSVLYSTSEYEAGTEVVLSDAEGNVILSFTPTVQFSCLVLSDPALEEGSTCTLSIGGEETEITLDSVSTSIGSQGFGGFGGFGGR